MNIYVGNLSSDVSEQELRNLFSPFGHINSVKIIRDMYTGASKGFGFIDIPVEADARKAIKQLNSKNINGKNIIVNEAHSNNDRRPSGNNSRNYKNAYTSRENGNSGW